MLAIPGIVELYAAPVDALAYNGMQCNGNFEVDQIYAGASIAVGSGSVGNLMDSWKTYRTGAWGGVTFQQSNNNQPEVGGFAKGIVLKVATGAAPAANDTFIFGTVIEGYRVARLAMGYSSASPLTIAFMVWASIAGTFSVAAQNQGSTRSFVKNITINAANTWEYKTVTIPGDVAGTWIRDNGIGLNIWITVASDAANFGTEGVWLDGNRTAAAGISNFFPPGSSNNIFVINGFLVLPGIIAPPRDRLPFLMRPFGDELMICRRYWQIVTVYHRFMAQAASDAHDLTLPFVPVMRAVPTMNLTPGALSNVNSGAGYPYAQALDRTAFRHELFSAGAGGCFTQGDMVTADARL